MVSLTAWTRCEWCCRATDLNVGSKWGEPEWKMRLTKELSISKNEYKQGASETQHNPPIKNHTLIHFGYILIFRKCFQIFPTFVNSIQLFWKAFPLFGNRIQFFWKWFLSFGNRFHLLETVCLNWIEYQNYGNSFGFNWIQYPNNGNSFRFNWIQYPNNENGFHLNCIQYPNNGYISVYPKWISVRSDYIVWEGD